MSTAPLLPDPATGLPKSVPDPAAIPTQAAEDQLDPGKVLNTGPWPWEAPPGTSPLGMFPPTQSKVPPPPSAPPNQSRPSDKLFGVPQQMGPAGPAFGPADPRLTNAIQPKGIDPEFDMAINEHFARLFEEDKRKLNRVFPMIAGENLGLEPKRYVKTRIHLPSAQSAETGGMATGNYETYWIPVYDDQSDEEAIKTAQDLATTNFEQAFRYGIRKDFDTWLGMGFLGDAVDLAGRKFVGLEPGWRKADQAFEAMNPEAATTAGLSSFPLYFAPYGAIHGISFLGSRATSMVGRALAEGMEAGMTPTTATRLLGPGPTLIGEAAKPNRFQLLQYAVNAALFKSGREAGARIIRKHLTYDIIEPAVRKAGELGIQFEQGRSAYGIAGVGRTLAPKEFVEFSQAMRAATGEGAKWVSNRVGPVAVGSAILGMGTAKLAGDSLRTGNLEDRFLTLEEAARSFGAGAVMGAAATTGLYAAGKLVQGAPGALGALRRANVFLGEGGGVVSSFNRVKGKPPTPPLKGYLGDGLPPGPYGENAPPVLGPGGPGASVYSTQWAPPKLPGGDPISGDLLKSWKILTNHVRATNDPETKSLVESLSNMHIDISTGNMLLSAAQKLPDQWGNVDFDTTPTSYPSDSSWLSNPHQADRDAAVYLDKLGGSVTGKLGTLVPTNPLPGDTAISIYRIDGRLVAFDEIYNRKGPDGKPIPISHEQLDVTDSLQGLSLRRESKYEFDPALESPVVMSISPSGRLTIDEAATSQRHASKVGWQGQLALDIQRDPGPDPLTTPADPIPPSLAPEMGDHAEIVSGQYQSQSQREIARRILDEEIRPPSPQAPLPPLRRNPDWPEATELVPVKDLLTFRMASPAVPETMRTALREQGVGGELFRLPLILEVNPNGGFMILGNGNTRLQLADEEGVEALPTIVLPTSVPQSPRPGFTGGQAPIPPPTSFERRYYKPSEVGLRVVPFPFPDEGAAGDSFGNELTSPRWRSGLKEAVTKAGEKFTKPLPVGPGLVNTVLKRIQDASGGGVNAEELDDTGLKEWLTKREEEKTPTSWEDINSYLTDNYSNVDVIVRGQGIDLPAGVTRNVEYPTYVSPGAHRNLEYIIQADTPKTRDEPSALYRGGHYGGKDARNLLGDVMISDYGEVSTTKIPTNDIFKANPEENAFREISPDAPPATYRLETHFTGPITRLINEGPQEEWAKHYREEQGKMADQANLIPKTEREIQEFTGAVKSLREVVKRGLAKFGFEDQATSEAWAALILRSTLTDIPIDIGVNPPRDLETARLNRQILAERSQSFTPYALIKKRLDQVFGYHYRNLDIVWAFRDNAGKNLSTKQLEDLSQDERSLSEPKLLPIDVKARYEFLQKDPTAKQLARESIDPNELLEFDTLPHPDTGEPIPYEEIIGESGFKEIESILESVDQNSLNNLQLNLEQAQIRLKRLKEGNVPPPPFKTEFISRALKQILSDSVDAGIDTLAVNTASSIGTRYGEIPDLNSDGTFDLTGDDDGKLIIPGEWLLARYGDSKANIEKYWPGHPELVEKYALDLPNRTRPPEVKVWRTLQKILGRVGIKDIQPTPVTIETKGGAKKSQPLDVFGIKLTGPVAEAIKRSGFKTYARKPEDKHIRRGKRPAKGNIIPGMPDSHYHGKPSIPAPVFAVYPSTMKVSHLTARIWDSAYSGAFAELRALDPSKFKPGVPSYNENWTPDDVERARMQAEYDKAEAFWGGPDGMKQWSKWLRHVGHPAKMSPLQYERLLTLLAHHSKALESNLSDKELSEIYSHIFHRDMPSRLATELARQFNEAAGMDIKPQTTHTPEDWGNGVIALQTLIRQLNGIEKGRMLAAAELLDGPDNGRFANTKRFLITIGDEIDRKWLVAQKLASTLARPAGKLGMVRTGEEAMSVDMDRGVLYGLDKGYVNTHTEFEAKTTEIYDIFQLGKRRPEVGEMLKEAFSTGYVSKEKVSAKLGKSPILIDTFHGIPYPTRNTPQEFDIPTVVLRLREFFKYYFNDGQGATEKAYISSLNADIGTMATAIESLRSKLLDYLHEAVQLAPPEMSRQILDKYALVIESLRDNPIDILGSAAIYADKNRYNRTENTLINELAQLMPTYVSRDMVVNIVARIAGIWRQVGRSRERRASIESGYLSSISPLDAMKEVIKDRIHKKHKITEDQTLAGFFSPDENESLTKLGTTQDFFADLAMFISEGARMNHLEPALARVYNDVGFFNTTKGPERIQAGSYHDLPPEQLPTLEALLKILMNEGADEPSRQAMLQVAMAARAQRETIPSVLAGILSRGSTLAQRHTERPLSTRVSTNTELSELMMPLSGYFYSVTLDPRKTSLLNMLDVAWMATAVFEQEHPFKAASYAPRAALTALKDVTRTMGVSMEKFLVGRAGTLPESRLHGSLTMSQDLAEINSKFVNPLTGKSRNPLSRAAQVITGTALSPIKFFDLWARGTTYYALKRYWVGMGMDEDQAINMARMTQAWIHTMSGATSTSVWSRGTHGRMIRPLLTYSAAKAEDMANQVALGAWAGGARRVMPESKLTPLAPGLDQEAAAGGIGNRPPPPSGLTPEEAEWFGTLNTPPLPIGKGYTPSQKAVRGRLKALTVGNLAAGLLLVIGTKGLAHLMNEEEDRLLMASLWYPSKFGLPYVEFWSSEATYLYLKMKQFGFGTWNLGPGRLVSMEMSDFELRLLAELEARRNWIDRMPGGKFFTNEWRKQDRQLRDLGINPDEPVPTTLPEVPPS